ncbi:(d)CMP kinase [Mycoplasma sp. ES3157-GEN-MYC]|uniref:Cytidylate kinase n=1 Tax=Mycoplasma miroungigenitalium TaxID=754515 RepID=A0A6M4JAN3_9MOLU|nr:(d)CMP kinase [Mycoplasma miroungigenitalium]MBU4690363.1 (d)CMP kinase [Mycoplasma miroungigenitalium]MBU4691630.1 (d)CMP kinase [Mycoplasma miroungigenitalium]QJR43455.1 (d)CMP kinase [Mycoplasma miroungigenitalium]
MKKINVAIDGPSGAGKSTVSKEVAKRLGYTFISSGSVYRAIAYVVSNKNIDPKNEEAVNAILDDQILKISLDEHERIYSDGVDISSLIRADKISKISSDIAVYKHVREYVVKYIQQITKAKKGYIMDGRDTTYRIMPYAEVKIFLTATAHERANRRILQNKELGYNTNFHQVLKEVEARDEQDSNRKNDPLKIVEDAHVINCTEMNFEAVVVEIIRLIKAVVNEK